MQRRLQREILRNPSLLRSRPAPALALPRCHPTVEFQGVRYTVYRTPGWLQFPFAPRANSRWLTHRYGGLRFLLFPQSSDVLSG